VDDLNNKFVEDNFDMERAKKAALERKTASFWKRNSKLLSLVSTVSLVVLFVLAYLAYSSITYMIQHYTFLR